MKKQFITKGFTDGKQPRITILEIIEGDCGFNQLELHCEFNEIETLLVKALSDLKSVKDFQVLSYKRKHNEEMKDIPSYKQEHISLRYFLARKYTPHDLLDPFEKIERDLSDSFEEFKKSLKPPFDKIIND